MDTLKAKAFTISLAYVGIGTLALFIVGTKSIMQNELASILIPIITILTLPVCFLGFGVLYGGENNEWIALLVQLIVFILFWQMLTKYMLSRNKYADTYTVDRGTRFVKIAGITVLCCLIDGIARSLLPGWGLDHRAWLYYTLLILTVGDIFYYLLFVVAFELINARFNRRQSTRFSISISFVLAVVCFFLFSSLRFWTVEQKTIMGFTYGLIGILYGYLYAHWVPATSHSD
ncbi:hypothetical protein [Spirosoma agri]|uniref:Uncharacterized protein n=1 Tax=Spirosoma agri TaxID=1987381 RepID=A0A6M0ITM3_9BACT|nr:hypothetical protein [Spirosoma agri]NEU70643.1 hypothetical protein [Spirosoma agri]